MTYIYRNENGDLRYVRAPLGTKSGWKYTGGNRKRKRNPSSRYTTRLERFDDWLRRVIELLFGNKGAA